MRDAVIVVPGVMGSELRDSDGQVLWGLSARVLGRAWVSGKLPSGLHVTDEDLNHPGRVTATRLLRVPAYMPFLGGLEPYTTLLDQLRMKAGDSRAIAEFPYDWRLPVTLAGEELVIRGLAHLAKWREVVRETKAGDPDEVQLFIVAHSMGGLVTRAALEDAEFAQRVRHVVTLGTPYFGSVDTVRLLATGDGAPVPQLSARALARGCPGVYDLLPRYICVDAPDGRRSLSLADLASIGASTELGAAALARWQSLDLATPGYPAPISAVVGTHQPTLSSIHFRDGGMGFSERTIDDDPDAAGDSRVSRRAAAPLGTTAMPLPQKHGALARSVEGIGVVIDKLLNRDGGPLLGTRAFGARIPDVVNAGRGIHISVAEFDPDGSPTKANPIGISVTSQNLETGRTEAWRVGMRATGGDLTYAVDALQPGLHRVTIDGGGYSPISDIMLVLDPHERLGRHP